MDDIARLGSNENPDGCAPAVMEVLRSGAVEPWRYADPACVALREALGEETGVDPDSIVVGNGSEELIGAICRTVLRAGDEVVTVVPSFGLHEIEPLAMGALVTKVGMTAALDFDVEALLAALTGRPRMLMLSSPSNPVGVTLSADALHRIVAALPPETLLVLDEAYAEYAGAGGDENTIELLDRAGVRYVVLRTFSKAYGLAGLRVGYALTSHQELAAAMTKAKSPFNVNAAAQAAAMAALSNGDWMRASVARVKIERQRVFAALRELGFRPAQSDGNFVFFDCGHDSGECAAFLLSRGIIVKPWKEEGYTTFLRVTVGLRDENDRFIRELEAFSSRAGSIPS
jgi:histidinol-phosphate aminotransferase